MISLSDWERGGTFTTLAGHRLFCREGGSPTQPALVLLHGFPTSSWDFEAIWVELTARYRVTTLDLIGSGFSDKPSAFSYTIHEQADRVSGSHMAAKYREVVPSADVTLLEGIGHYPQVEAPQAVLEAYLQFRRAAT